MKRKTKGGLLIASPFVLLPAVLSAYAIINFLMSEVGSGAGALSVIGNILNVVLGFAGILAVLGFFVAIPLGIYLLSTKDKAPTDDAAA